MKKMTYLLAFSLIISSFSAQITFVKGYLITEKGDTLLGEIKMNPKKEFDLFNKVFFKDESGVQKNYKPKMVKGYGFENKNFITSVYDNDPMFYRILTSGTLSVYEMMYEMQAMNEISYKSEYFIAQKEEKEFTKIKHNKYKKQLSELMKDNPDIVENAEEDKKFEIEKVVELVNQYNNWATSK